MFDLKNWKLKSLIGRSLLQTALILAGNQTQVTFSGIIPLDHLDLRFVNTVWMNRYQTAYIIHVKAFHWIIEYYFWHHMQFQQVIVCHMMISSEMYQILISLSLRSIQIAYTTLNLKHLNFKKWHKFIQRSQILLRFEYTVLFTDW